MQLNDIWVFEVVEHIDLCLNPSVFVLKERLRYFIFVNDFESVDLLLIFDDADFTKSLLFGYVFDLFDLREVDFSALGDSDVCYYTDWHYNRYD
jgi:hypothetical protein